MLKVHDLHAGYGPVTILRDVNLEASSGEITCIMGRNGAGKTTLLRSIMGIASISSGTIELAENEISGEPSHVISRKGIGYIPQGRRLFPELTVNENIDMGLMYRDVPTATKDWLFDLFPRLKERTSQQAGTLSGGEQQMLATARALAMRPDVLLLDEPMEGLQPSMVALIRDVIVKMRDQNIAIILVEQRIDEAFSLADQINVLEHGKVVQSVRSEKFAPHADKIKAHLGV